MRRSYASASGDELLTWAQEGDQRAFAALVQPHRELLYAICFRITGAAADAEDALQDAMLAAWRNLHRFEGRSKLSTWLVRIAHNAALAGLRKRVASPMEDDLLEARIDHRASHEGSVDAVHTVRWALAKLPPDFRAAIVLREYGGLTYEEIAEVQGIKIETVKTRIARARKAVAQLVEA